MTILLQELPSIDTGEITDKGYINQQAVHKYLQGWLNVLHAWMHR
ncbi:MAG: hypothetical protein ACRCV9_19695 [Burkholderiaceae bacterium]